MVKSSEPRHLNCECWGIQRTNSGRAKGYRLEVVEDSSFITLASHYPVLQLLPYPSSAGISLITLVRLVPTPTLFLCDSRVLAHTPDHPILENILTTVMASSPILRSRVHCWLSIACFSWCLLFWSRHQYWHSSPSLISAFFPLGSTFAFMCASSLSLFASQRRYWVDGSTLYLLNRCLRLDGQSFRSAGPLYNACNYTYF